jgi:predicted TIM-barrel fold metal-dependent hydrolase
MGYNSTGLVVHDADAHIMETPTWLYDYADPSIRDRVDILSYPGGNELQQSDDLLDHRANLEEAFERLAERHRSEEYTTVEADEIMLRKNFAATGSFLPEDRPRALDLLGFASQLVFNTFHNSRLYNWEHSGDLELAIGAARAHNRGMADFCSVDRRLLSTLYVPLADIERAGALAQEAIDMGAGALLIASGCPPTHSPSHVGLDPVWAAAQEAGVPIVFHVGGTGDLLDPHYFDNGLPVPPDFHGGEENFRSVDYMAIPGPPAQTLATMIFDGVFERFPDLRVGVIEQGAIWVPSWMRQMESAFEAFSRHEERLRGLSMRPSEYVRRQMKFTPYPTEDVGWIIDQAGAQTVLFSSDYPHVEGGRRPIERFERSMEGCSDATRQAFYHDNFVDLMGQRLDAALVAS